MNVLRTLGFLAVLLAMTGANPAPAAAGSKTVIELFTSQGCNSCPPADALLGKLAENPNLIPLTLSVDYWDYLGWKDTLALNLHTLRQRNYARVRGDMNVYTPQAIVNGVKYAVGSDAREIDRAIRNHPGNEAEIPLQLRKTGDTISIEVGPGQGKATVWLVAVTGKVQVAIARGENRGATITYWNVARSWRNIAAYTGAPVKTSVAISELTKSGADAVVVFVQNGTENAPGAIRAADMLALR